MKILVIGGMHGNEPLGLAVVKAFQTSPAKNIEVVLANQKAILVNKRFVSADLNRSFPGDPSSTIYEIKRAAEIVELCKQFDVVMDFHNTNCPDNDCSFIGQDAAKILDQVSLTCNLKRVVVADYDCLNKYAKNCISIEISLSSKLNDAEYWVKKIIELGSKKTLKQTDKAEKFRFVYRMTLEDRDRLKLESRNLKAFVPLDISIAKSLGVKSPAFPIFIADEFTPYNFGGLLNKYK